MAAIWPLGKAQPTVLIEDRVIEFRNLLASVEGLAEEPPRIHLTKDGYLVFIMAPPSSHIEVAKPQDWKPEDVADTFVRQWKGLLTSESAAMELKRVRSLHRQNCSIIRYNQEFAGLEVHAASIIVQVDKLGGVDAVSSDIMRDSAVFETGQVSLQPTIDPVTAKNKAITWLLNDWRMRYRVDSELKLDASTARLMIFAPCVVGKQGSPHLVWQFDVRSAVAPIHEYVLLDAHNGEVVHHYSLIDYALPPNAERWVFNSNNTNSAPRYKIYAARYEGMPPIGDSFIDDLYDYLGYSLTFFWEEHDLDGWDGSGSVPIRSYARYLYPSIGFTKDMAWYDDGTHWPSTNPEGIYIGEWSLACDLVAHEYTHGVQYHINQFDGSGESGAIQESLADSWGEWIAQTYDSSNVAWEMFDQTIFVSLPEFQKPWRVMDNPPSVNTHSSYGSDFGNVPQPDRYNSDFYYRLGSPYFPIYHDQDNGGAHHNCGVGNKLCYLLTEEGTRTFNGHTITGFGISNTAHLYYECLLRLPTACDYYDLGNTLIWAACILGMTADERDNVKNACAAVEILSNPEDCYPVCDPNYADWVTMGKPSCWCDKNHGGSGYQCDGDADGQTETILKYRVYGKDLTLVQQNWKKKAGDLTLNPCADIDHQEETAYHYRVYGKDLSTVVKYWKKKDSQLPGNCPRCGQSAAKGQPAALDIDALVKWLEEVWLDPEVQKVLDEKAWNQLVESLKEYSGTTTQ